MERRSGMLKGFALLSVGAVAALAATRIQVSFGPTHAGAASPPPVTMQPALPPPSQAQVADARAFSRTFAQVAEQLKPSVVSIVVEKGGRPSHTPPSLSRRFRRGGPGGGGEGGGGGGSPFQGTPFERFFGFGNPFGNGDEGEGPGQGQEKQVGAGSGVVIDAKGYILTNNHVVEDADVIKVKFADGHEVKGTIAGTDPKTDLAVVKVNEQNLIAARFGDSEKLQPGEWVIAIGNPYGFDHTVTVGVISAKGRRGLGAGPYEDFLQTDAAINPGNSGGPLVNLDGEVIGINTMIRGIGTMIGFAIPSSMARPISGQLINGGHVRRPYLGIVMQDVTPELAASLGAGAPSKGAIVGQVEADSPAVKAGVRPGDVIVKVDGEAVDGSKAVQKTVLAKSLGQKLTLDVWRSGKTMQIAATTAERKEENEKKLVSGGDEGASKRGKLGIELQTLTPELAERLGVAGQQGAVVAGVRPDSPAAEAGIREGDVIVEVDQKKVATADDAAKVLSAARAGGHLLRVQRGDGALFVVVPAA